MDHAVTASHLGAGTHTVVFSKAGYLQQSRSVQSEAGKSVCDLGRYASRRIHRCGQQQSAGRKCLIDGRDTGMTTPAQLTMEKGQHKITVRKPGLRTVPRKSPFLKERLSVFHPF